MSVPAWTAKKPDLSVLLLCIVAMNVYTSDLFRV